MSCPNEVCILYLSLLQAILVMIRQPLLSSARSIYHQKVYETILKSFHSFSCKGTEREEIKPIYVVFFFTSYVLSVVEKLVVDDYVIVYLHSGAPRNSMPGIQWFHRFYRIIDRR